MKGKILTGIIIILLTSCEKGVQDNDTILKFFSESYADAGNSIAKGEDGYFICGQLTDDLSNNATKKFGVIKTGFDGNMIGEPFVYGETGGSANKIITLNDGTVACTGYVLDDNGKKDIIVMHLSSDMTEIIPPRRYPMKDNQYGVDILETSEGFLVLATTDAQQGSTGNPLGKKDILLMRLKPNLDTLSVIPAQGYPGDDEGVAVKKDRSGGYIVLGTTDKSDPNSGQSGTNIIIMRLNSDGSTTESRIIGGTANEAASDFEVLSDGYLIAGTIGNPGSTQRGHIWKMPFDIYSVADFDNDIVLNSGESNVPFAIKAMCRYRLNSFLLAGQYGTGLSARLLVFSIDAYGVPVADREKITGGTGTQVANDVISDDSDNIIAVGSNSYENNSMICFLKFRF